MCVSPLMSISFKMLSALRSSLLEGALGVKGRMVFVLHMEGLPNLRRAQGLADAGPEDEDGPLGQLAHGN